MAQIKEEVIVIKLSKLVKNADDGESLVNDDIIAALEQVAQELSPAGVIAEVEIAQ